jgi:hypothetical protein
MSKTKKLLRDLRGTMGKGGLVQEVTAKKLALLEIDTQGRWDEVRHFRLKDITRIDFGGGYEAALAAVAEEDARRETGRCGSS